ncbi:MAG: ferredoxin-thioredoxin reductase catalytic domain-containing protein [Candidatus Pacebacteria bacterium]|nr:ferredoxin-thioredoxin reductase catalytic domain-containing protein [Candidatus Paceibacterota bacterium]
MEHFIKKCEEYAKGKGFKLNPNRKIVEGITKGLLEREKKFGKKYCPCRRVTGDKEEDKKLICPCFFHEKEIKEEGRCYCGLFVR